MIQRYIQLTVNMCLNSCYKACADPESVVRGAPALTTFFFCLFSVCFLVHEGGKGPNTTLSVLACQQNAI